MGREKARKPRKPEKEIPRIVDMANVSAETKKNVVLSNIIRDQAWGSLHAVLTSRYGEFTVEERDLLDLPTQQRHEAMNDLVTYASAQLPAQAPLDVREAAAKGAANCQQALARLVPLAEQIAIREGRAPAGD